MVAFAGKQTATNNVKIQQQNLPFKACGQIMITINLFQ